MKVCDPKDPHAADFCQHRLDRIGVEYICPNTAQTGIFEICDSDNADYPGIYTLSDGTTTSYSQPPDSLGPITTMPYTAKIPSSSNCVTFQSSDLFSGLPTPTGVQVAAVTGGASGAAAATGGAAPSKGSSGAAGASRTGSSGAASPTNSDAPQTGAASTVRTSAFATVAGVAVAIAFFA